MKVNIGSGEKATPPRPAPPRPPPEKGKRAQQNVISKPENMAESKQRCRKNVWIVMVVLIAIWMDHQSPKYAEMVP
jgi:hypothetical protein